MRHLTYNRVVSSPQLATRNRATSITAPLHPNVQSPHDNLSNTVLPGSMH
jgi:hypothetical protein